MSGEALAFEARNVLGVRRALVVSWMGSGRDPRSAISLVRARLDEGSAPELVALLVAADNQTARDAFLSDPYIRNLAERSGIRTESVSFDGRGGLSANASGLPTSDANALRAEGLRHIASRSEVVERLGAHVHFAKDSGAHSQSFVRVAGGLVTTASTDFAAACLMSRLRPETRLVYVDTPGIGGIVAAASSLRWRLDPDAEPLSFSSFGSYAGIGDFDFGLPGADQRSVALISVVTREESRLLRDLTDRGVESVVLYWWGAARLPAGASLAPLCDVHDGTGEFERIESFSAGDCELCRAGSGAVPIRGGAVRPSPSRGGRS